MSLILDVLLLVSSYLSPKTLITHLDFEHACARVRAQVMFDSATPWTVAHHAPLSMGSLQARIQEWVSMPSSRGSSQPWDQTLGSPALQVYSLPTEPPGKPRTCSDPTFN